ncbi:MAG: DUF481 domain-containing protein [Acidobacteriota bacterium]
MNKKKTLLITIMIIIAVVNSFSQVNVEKYRMESSKDGTNADISISTTLIKGNTEVLNIDAASGIFHKNGKNQFFLKSTLNFGKKNDDKYINKGFIHIRGVRELTTAVSIEIFMQNEFDEFILLKNRKLGGAGARFKLLSKENFSIFAGTGLMYEVEKFSGRDGRILKMDTEFLKITNYISLNRRFNKSSSLGMVTYWQARTSRLADHRFLSNISLRFKVSGSLSFVSAINHRYDSNPPLTIKKYDLTIKSGFSLSI